MREKGNRYDWRKVKEIMNDGKLVDDVTMLSLVEERIHRPDCGRGFILDGYPRNLSQAGALSKVLGPHMQIKVFEINVSDEDILKRIAGRRTCPECERIYNMHFAPPQSDEKCDVDGTALILRNDDREDVVRRRLETYRKETYPLISHYKNLGVLKVVNGFQPKEKVADTICKLW